MSSVQNDPIDISQLAGLFEAVTHKMLNPKYEVPAISINFMKFPVEIRAKIIEHYLLGEVEGGTIGKAIHWDHFNKECCVWKWPNQLIICDKENPDDLPHTMFPKWLPNLALTNHQMHGEVVVHMLKTTDEFMLKFDHRMPIKIAPWFAKFLATFPGITGAEGFESIRDINFPHIHWYHHNGHVLGNTTNPDVDLMLKLPNLKRVGFTFHALKVNKANVDERVSPISLSQFLNKFHLRPMLGCKALEHVYIGGILHRWFFEEEGDQLQTLRVFGKWLREEFQKKNQVVTVHLHERRGIFRGWGVGEPL